MVPNPLPEDRSKILRHLGTNMVVEAGAGTGKTTLLIMRICLAVLAQGIAVEKIVALTFTEKAAAEIKTRLVSALHRLIRDLNLPAEKQTQSQNPLLDLLYTEFALKKEILLERAQTALAHLDRASVGTIHSFCADILKTFPLEAGLSPNSEIDPGPKGTRLFNLRWNAFLEKELGVHAPRAGLWKGVLPEISLEELKDFARELCSGKIEQYDYFSHSELVADSCQEKARQAKEWSTAFLSSPAAKPRNIEKALIWAADSLNRSAKFLRQRGKIEPADPMAELPVLSSAVTKGWDEDTFESARSLVQFALKIRPQQQLIFQQAVELVRPAVEQIRSDYAREGILSFDDLIVKTRNLVQQNLYVRRLLKEKFDILFIDEFQDTDPVQGELLLFLAEEKSSGASRWQEVKLEAGKLFVVGDPKQSIYRFRGADITAYELFTRLILSQRAEKCFLRCNFRSTPQIVALANEVCSRAMVEQPAFQPAYEPIFPIKPEQKDSVSWLFVESAVEGALADDFRANQAERIADWISQQVGNWVLADGRKLMYKDIAILSRASTTAGPYTDALRRRGIPFNTDSEKDFYRRQEINDFLNFLRVVADPTDKTALVGVLRSPLGGISDETIYQLARSEELSLSAKPQNAAVQRIYELINRFTAKVGRVPVRDLLEEILDQTFLAQACAAAYEGERTLAVLEQLVQLAQDMAARMPVSLGQFLAELQNLLENDPEQLGPAPTQDDDAVHVMTVHKSKGLDFPVVILADLSKKEAVTVSMAPHHLFSWRYNMHGLRAGRICDANLAFLEEEQRKHERCEEIRILYVALTRAKEHLLLVADGRKGAEKAAVPFVSAGVWPSAKGKTHTDKLNIPVLYAAYQKPEEFLYRAKNPPVQKISAQELQQWGPMYQARKKRYDELLAERKLSPSEQVEIETDGALQQEGAQLGTICHQVLQLFLASQAPELEKLIHQVVTTSGLNVPEEKVAALLLPFVESETFAQLKQQICLARELPFSFVTDGGQIQSGIMDAVLRQPDGTIWVIDYKTDQIPAGGTAELLEKYRSQLDIYAQAAKKIFQTKQVRCSAVFIRTFAVCDL